MKRFLALLFVAISIPSQAQSPEIQARAAFLKAQEFYGNGDYYGAIDRLDNVKELLGSTNPRVEYLLCQSHFANKDADKAESALKKYFELADASDPNYNQMLLMIEEIKAKKEEFKKEQERIAFEKELSAKEPEVWQKTVSIDSREAFQAYLATYPSGQFTAEARKALLKFPPSPLVDERNGETYPTIRVGGLVWMSTNLNYASPDSRCYTDDQENCEEYGRIYGFAESRNVCPTGWRLPNFRELQRLLSSYDLKESAKKNPDVMTLRFEDKSFGTFGQELNLYPAGTFVRRNPPGIKEDTYKLMGEYAVYWTEDGRLVLNAVGKKSWLQLSNTDNLSGFRETDKKLFGYCRCIQDEGAAPSLSDEKLEEMQNRLMKEALNKVFDKN